MDSAVREVVTQFRLRRDALLSGKECLIIPPSVLRTIVEHSLAGNSDAAAALDLLRSLVALRLEYKSDTQEGGGLAPIEFLDKLQVLEVYNTPAPDIFGLAKFREHLKRLVLQRCLTNSMDAFVSTAPWISLTTLDVAQNGLESIDESFPLCLPALVSFDASHNALRSLPDFRFCRSLVRVDLAYNMFTSCASIAAAVPGVRYLSLHHNRIASVADLSKLNALEDLNLSFNAIASPADLAPLATLRLLRRLQVVQNPVTATRTARIDVLSVLDADRTLGMDLDGTAVSQAEVRAATERARERLAASQSRDNVKATGAWPLAPIAAGAAIATALRRRRRRHPRSITEPRGRRSRLGSAPSSPMSGRGSEIDSPTASLLPPLPELREAAQLQELVRATRHDFDLVWLNVLRDKLGRPRDDDAIAQRCLEYERYVRGGAAVAGPAAAVAKTASAIDTSAQSPFAAVAASRSAKQQQPHSQQQPSSEPIQRGASRESTTPPAAASTPSPAVQSSTSPASAAQLSVSPGAVSLGASPPTAAATIRSSGAVAIPMTGAASQPQRVVDIDVPGTSPFAARGMAVRPAAGFAAAAGPVAAATTSAMAATTTTTTATAAAVTPSLAAASHALTTDRTSKPTTATVTDGSARLPPSPSLSAPPPAVPLAAVHQQQLPQQPSAATDSPQPAQAIVTPAAVVRARQVIIESPNQAARTLGGEAIAKPPTSAAAAATAAVSTSTAASAVGMRPDVSATPPLAVAQQVSPVAALPAQSPAVPLSSATQQPPQQQPPQQQQWQQQQGTPALQSVPTGVLSPAVTARLESARSLQPQDEPAKTEDAHEATVQPLPTVELNLPKLTARVDPVVSAPSPQDSRPFVGAGEKQQLEQRTSSQNSLQMYFQTRILQSQSETVLCCLHGSAVRWRDPLTAERPAGIVVTDRAVYILTDLEMTAGGAAKGTAAAGAGRGGPASFMEMLFRFKPGQAPGGAGAGAGATTAPATAAAAAATVGGAAKTGYERWAEVPLGSITEVHVALDSQYVRLQQSALAGFVLLTRSETLTRALIDALVGHLSPGVRVVKHRSDTLAAITKYLATSEEASHADDSDSEHDEQVLVYALVLRADDKSPLQLRSTHSYGAVLPLSLVLTTKRCLLCVETYSHWPADPTVQDNAPAVAGWPPQFRIVQEQPFENLMSGRVVAQSPEILVLNFEKADSWFLLTVDTADRDRIVTAAADHWELVFALPFMVSS